MSDPLSGAVADYNGKIKEIKDKLAAAIEAKARLALAEDPVALRVEYQVAVDIIKLLSDIRFRCLTFVTAVTAVDGSRYRRGFARLTDICTTLNTMHLLLLREWPLAVIVDTTPMTVFNVRLAHLSGVGHKSSRSTETRTNYNGGTAHPLGTGLT